MSNVSEQRNKYGLTQAMLIARSGIIPPEELNHDPSYVDENGMTVAMYLAQKQIKIPQTWKHLTGLQNNQGLTVAMYIAQQREVDFDQLRDWFHFPDKYDNREMTVAMYLAVNKKYPPEEWYHCPNQQCSAGITVAMYLSMVGLYPPEKWQHNPYITTIKKKTIIYHAELNKVKLSKVWYLSERMYNLYKNRKFGRKVLMKKQHWIQHIFNGIHTLKVLNKIPLIPLLGETW